MENRTIPGHVALIPDGNRRWAKERNLQPWKGHEAGAKNIEELVKTALEEGVECLSFWGSSLDNLIKRPLSEKKALLEIYKKYFQRIIDSREIHENEARISVIGHWESQFPEPLKKIIREAVAKTRHYRKKMLNFFLAYNGTDDVLRAVEKIVEKRIGLPLTEEIFKENLMTSELPKVDFLVRTGGEPHNSNGFLMWDAADAQLYFSPCLFPDFNGEKLKEALGDYARRQRRFGK